METNDEFRERIRREGQIAARLRLATDRLEEAQQERIWAVVEAHQLGLSIRQIAAATGLSPSRVHQLLGSEEAREIPRWLSQRRGQDAAPAEGQTDFQACLATELTALRRCREWLELLGRGERVIVNLRPESDSETEYVAFDGPRILRVLGRIIADLDALAGLPPLAEEESRDEDAEARRVRHRKSLSEPEPQPKRLSVREERALLRALLERPPYDRD
jgi:AraC-like DNA-binding protein